MAIALDGSAHADGTNAVALTTSLSNDLIALVATINDTTGSSVSSSNTTGWALRKRQSTGASSVIELWVGVAASPLSTETITLTLAGAAGFITVDAFGISGADTTTKFDSNAALPDGQTTTTCSITTSNADDFLLGCYRFGTTPNPTEGTGWTKISGAGYTLTEYKIVSATQSAVTVPIGTGNTDENAGIGDAFIQASGAALQPAIITPIQSNLRWR